MPPVLLTFALALLVSAEPGSHNETPRQANPLAPSLPLLTDEEEEQLDKIIDRFIQFDIGRLGAAEGKEALAEFQRLRSDATFALIRGLNRAARIEGSCPAVTIAKKLALILRASNDLELLEFARENIGAGVTQSRHMGVLKDLRFTCMLRKREVVQAGAAFRAAPKPIQQNSLRTLSTSQLLLEASNAARGPRRDQVIRELDQRPRDQVLGDLGGVAADSSSTKGQQAARGLLDSFLSRQTAMVVKEKLQDDSPEVRAAAARVVGGKRLPLAGELIELLADDKVGVRDAAHASLVRLKGGADFGPAADANEQERSAAVRKWRDWWDKNPRKK